MERRAELARRIAGIVTLLLCCAPELLPARTQRTEPNAIAVLDTSPVNPEYFGLHVHRASGTTTDEPQSAWPRMRDWSWRLWDARVAWKDIELRRGEFNFTRLDALCAKAAGSGVQILLTLGLTPRWASSRPDERSNYDAGNQAPPTDLEDWRRYVDTVAKRYRGRIAAYEVWNEPNLRGFYSGSPEELVALAQVAYHTIKAADPQATVVTPSATGVPGGARWLKNYLSAGGDMYADVVGFHFYVTPRDPEFMIAAFDSVRAVLAKTRLHAAPLWNTESGWLLQNHDVRVVPSGDSGSFASRVLDDTTGAAFVARALILGRCGSLGRFYWYAWDNRRMGLLDADGQHRKLEARGYDTVRSWLLGSKVTSCDVTSGGVWTVRLSRGATERAALVWATRGPTRYVSPFPTTVLTEWPLLGTPRRRRSGRTDFLANGVPTLVSNHATVRRLLRSD